MEYSPGLRAALPWEPRHRMSPRPEGAAEPPFPSDRSRAPSGHELLSHQTQAKLGVRTYVLQLDFVDTIPSFFVIFNNITYMIFKPAGEGPIHIFYLDDEKEKAKNKKKAKEQEMEKEKENK